MKRVDPAIRRDFPLFGNPWNPFAGDGIEPSQPFEHRKGHAYVRLAGENARIKRFRFGAVDNYKIRPPFRRRAAGKNCCEREKQGGDAAQQRTAAGPRPQQSAKLTDRQTCKNIAFLDCPRGRVAVRIKAATTVFRTNRPLRFREGVSTEIHSATWPSEAPAWAQYCRLARCLKAGGAVQLAEQSK